VGVVDEAVEDGVGQRRITEDLSTPQRLNDESLRSPSLIRIIRCMLTVIWSAIGALGVVRR
jgi:hypothetical protein